MKQLYLTFILCITFAQAFAQKDFRPGYVVLHGDTLRGYVDYRGAARSAKLTSFKPNLNAVEQQFSPTQISAYGFWKEQKVYETQTIPATGTQPEQQLFMHTLIMGKASVYTYRDGADFDHYFLSKDKGELLELIERKFDKKDTVTGKTYRMVDKAYLGTLRSAFYDCPDFDQNRLNNIRLSAASLTEIARKYNLCMNSDIAHQQEAAKTRIAVIPVITYSFPTLQATGKHMYVNGEYKSTGTGIGGGLAFNISNPTVSEKLSVQLELLYAPYKFEADIDDIHSSGRVTDHRLFYDIDYLKIPAQLRYTFPKGSIRPYLNAGLSFSYAAKVSQIRKTHSTFHTTSYYEEAEALPDDGFKRYMFGMIGGAGLSIPVQQKALLLETRYEALEGFSNVLSLSKRIKVVSLLAGFSF